MVHHQSVTTDEELNSSAFCLPHLRHHPPSCPGKTFGTIPDYSFPSFLTSIGKLLTGAKLHSLNLNLAPSLDLRYILVQTTEAPCPDGCSSLLARIPAKEGTPLPCSLFIVVYAASLSPTVLASHWSFLLLKHAKLFPIFGPLR